MGLSANSPPQSKKKSMKRDMQIKIIQHETQKEKRIKQNIWIVGQYQIYIIRVDRKNIWTENG